MSCRISFLKAVLAILNTVLSLLGIGLIALSVYELNTSTPGTFEHIAIVVQIFVGSFVILTSFLGCFSACRESVGFVWTYAICVLILLAFQIYIITAAYSIDYEQKAAQHFNALWHNQAFHATEIAEIEQKYHCCGSSGSQDYILLGSAIPKNCYKNFDRLAEHLYTNGCLEAVQEHANENGYTGLLIKWILFAVELLALGFAGFLGITISNKQRREQFGN